MSGDLDLRDLARTCEKHLVQYDGELKEAKLRPLSVQALEYRTWLISTYRDVRDCCSRRLYRSIDLLRNLRHTGSGPCQTRPFQSSHSSEPALTILSDPTFCECGATAAFQSRSGPKRDHTKRRIDAPSATLLHCAAPSTSSYAGEQGMVVSKAAPKQSYQWLLQLPFKLHPRCSGSITLLSDVCL